MELKFNNRRFMKKKLNVALAWYNRNEWDEWKKISPEEMEDTFEEWLFQAITTKADLEKKGYHVVQVIITPIEFLNWCRMNNIKPDSESRSRYVMEFSRN
jgi:hypothetical protein